MPIQQFMTQDTDCEIPATANACGLLYEDVAKFHDEIDGNWRDNANGSPYHILALLGKLGVPSRTITDDEILAGNVDVTKVILLVHSKDSPTLIQHWCNIRMMTPTHVVLNWNYPTKPTMVVTHEEFRRMYRDGFPNCAFLVGSGEVQKLSWWQRLWVWITGIFF